MFHIGRSGSTVFADLLNQHPQIYWDGEAYLSLFSKVFESWNEKVEKLEASVPPLDLIQFLHDRMAFAGQRYYGFEVKFFHLRLANVALPDYFDQLRQLGFDHFIVLKRRNFLRKIVSSLAARKRAATYHRQVGTQLELTRVYLDVGQIVIDRDAKPLLALLDMYQQCFHELDQYLDIANVLRLTYEDDIAADPRAAYQRACAFLDLAPHSVSVRYGRTNPFPLQEIIINYDEVKRVLADTPFAWMLYA